MSDKNNEETIIIDEKPENAINVTKSKFKKVRDFSAGNIKIIGIFALISAIAGIIWYIVFLNTYPWYEKSLNMVLSSVQNGDEKILQNAYPDFINVDINDRSALKHSLARLETYFGDNISITYKIIDKKKIKNEDLKNIQDKLLLLYGSENNINISDGANVNLKITLKGDVVSYTDDYTINIYRINGEWLTIPDEFKKFESFIKEECDIANKNFY